MEAQSESVQVRPYTENVFAVGNNSGVKFYVDINGRFYDKNMQLTNNVACLTDYDAQQVASQLNQAIGNKFHWDMFRGGEQQQGFRRNPNVKSLGNSMQPSAQP